MHTLTANEQEDWKNHRQNTIRPQMEPYFSHLNLLAEQYQGDTDKTYILNALEKYAKTVLDI